MSKEEEDKELDLEAIESDNKYLTEVYASDAVRQYLLNRERQLIAEVKRLREEVNELAFGDWDNPGNRTPGPFVPPYPDAKYPPVITPPLSISPY